MREITIIKPEGYCSGVKRAINIAVNTKNVYKDTNVYILGMLVHNKYVIDELNKIGIITINVKNEKDSLKAIENINKDSIIIFTAHGHSLKLEQRIKDRGIKIIDTTCPKVIKNINSIKEALKNGFKVFYIGKKHHPESLAYLSISKDVNLIDIDLPLNYHFSTKSKYYIISQTTINQNSLHDYIKQLINKYSVVNDNFEVCPATRIRQENILSIPQKADLIIVVGDSTSSNSKRLFEIAALSHPKSECIFINSKKDIDENKIKRFKSIYIASGASTPPEIVHDLEDYLKII